MTKLWYQAEIRWAVMEEGQGLREWKDAVYFFMSESPDAAFQYALEIGYRQCDVHEEDGKSVETRLAQIESLACLGTNRTEFAVPLAVKLRHGATVIRPRFRSGRAGAAGRFLIPNAGKTTGSRKRKLCFDEPGRRTRCPREIDTHQFAVSLGYG